MYSQQNPEYVQQQPLQQDGYSQRAPYSQHTVQAIGAGDNRHPIKKEIVDPAGIVNASTEDQDFGSRWSLCGLAYANSFIKTARSTI